MVRVASDFRSTLRSGQEQPEPKAPGSRSKPGWQPNLRQAARLIQFGRSRFRQFQLSLGTLRFAIVCFSQNWAMSMSFAQFFLATTYTQTHLFSYFLKIVHFP